MLGKTSCMRNTSILKLILALIIGTIFGTYITTRSSLGQVYHINITKVDRVSDGVKLQKNDDDEISKSPQADVTRTEIRHIGFLKVHKAASSTMQNIFYRFGLQRNLSFVLPRPVHYISKLKYSYNNLLPPFPIDSQSNEKAKYDILCNHVVFNNDIISDLLHEDAVYIAIVREPFELFLSSAYYYKYVWKFPYLDALEDDTFVTKLIREPEKYEAETMRDSMTFNSMAYDFGLDFTTVAEAENITLTEFEDFLTSIGNRFKLVMLVERFDESLILLKRHLNWTLFDILYIKSNVLSDQVTNKPQPNVTYDDMILFRHRNRFDYEIHEFFKARFDKQFKDELNIVEETEHFKIILKKVSDFCTAKLRKESQSSELAIEDSVWNDRFVVNKEDCNLMLKEELPFWEDLKRRHIKQLKARGAKLW